MEPENELDNNKYNRDKVAGGIGRAERGGVRCRGGVKRPRYWRQVVLKRRCPVVANNNNSLNRCYYRHTTTVVVVHVVVLVEFREQLLLLYYDIDTIILL